jgi:SAM-dependent methyltransferase
MILRYLAEKAGGHPRYFKLCMHIFNFLSLIGFKAKYHTHRFMSNVLNAPPDISYREGVDALRKESMCVLAEQRKKSPKEMLYMHGITHYQGLDLLHIPGARPTETRFKEYDLYNLINPNDRVLDLGCNNGFLLIYAAYIYNCECVGVDHNAYTIKVGEICVDYLGLNEKVKLHHSGIDEYVRDNAVDGYFSKVISFATHFTNDGGYRKTLEEHLTLNHMVLCSGGMLLFETHMTHSSEDSFNEILAVCSNGLFTCRVNMFIESVNRRFIVLEKI